MTNEEMTKLADMVARKILITTKDVLTTDEAAMYTGMSKAYIYKMTMRKELPYYKPGGKLVYFKRSELDAWITANRVSTDEELTEAAQRYCYTNKHNVSYNIAPGSRRKGRANESAG